MVISNMNWFAKKRTLSSTKRRPSAGKRRSSSTKRRPSTGKRRVSAGKRRVSSKRSNKVCFVKGKPRTAQPKVGSSGYFYTRRTPGGTLQRISVTGKTYTKTQALSRIKKTKK